MGNIQRDTGNVEDALISYRKGLAIDPNSDLLLENMQQLEEITGDAFRSLEIEIDAHGDQIEARHAPHEALCGGHVSTKFLFNAIVVHLLKIRLLLLVIVLKFEIVMGSGVLGLLME